MKARYDNMASSLIHIAVANEINKIIKRDHKKILIGTIAPDISKHIGEDKTRSHFLKEKDIAIPDLEKFLAKYENNLNDDFVMGYYIHLYTDYLWFKYFIPEIVDEDKLIITKLDGTKVSCSEKKINFYIYNDYTNLNNLLIDEYNLDLKIFYEEIPKLKNIIEEIPMDKINLIVEKAGTIIKNARITKEYLFGINEIKQFIKSSVDIILAELENMKII